MAQIQQQQLTQQQPQWQPSFDAEKTRRYIKLYKENPARFKEQDLENIRQHAAYHNVPFYEGDFSIFEALRQAGGGFLEGFTTLRVSDPPDNEYEAVARNIGHLAGFVPGILSGPLKALGVMSKSKSVMQAAANIGKVKSIPMLGADFVTKQAKKIISPIHKGAINSKFKAADEATKFFSKNQVQHITEGAFHLGVASSISSVWDGVDQMWESFKGGAVAGGIFRGIGNVIPGTKTGDKFIRGLAGSMFMGLPATARGATTPEQIYEYLAGAYFGSKEMPWYRAKAAEGFRKFDKEAEKNPKMEWERDITKMEGFQEYPELVRNELVRMAKVTYGEPNERLYLAERMMRELGITDKIPAEKLDSEGYEALNSVVKGKQKATRYKAHEKMGVAVSSGGWGANALWGKMGEKYGFPVIHMIPETVNNYKGLSQFLEMMKKGEIRGIQRGVTENELLSAGRAVERANNTLKRPIDNISADKYEKILNNWMVVKNAQSLYAIDTITTKGDLAYRTVDKTSAWPIQMALDKGMQKVFVFDQVQKSWFQWSTDAKRFKAINGVPKLGANPALVGATKLYGDGKKAIKDVFEVTFGKLEKGEKSPIKEAVDQNEIKEYHTQTLKNINNLKAMIDSHKSEIKDINQTIKEGKVDKVRVKELLKQKKELQNEVEKMFEEIETKHKVLEPTQYRDTITGQVITDVDIGMKGTDFALMKKSEYFSNEYLKDYWEKGNNLLSKRDKMIEAGKDAETIIRKYVERGNKNIKIDKVIEDMEDTFKITLKPEAVNHLRKWLRELNIGRQVTFVKTWGGSKIEFTKDERPTSATGKILRQIESPKYIEEVYDTIGGKYSPSEKVTKPIAVFDSVARSKKNGLTIDVPLKDLATHIRFTEGKVGKDGRKYPISEAEAIEKVNRIKGRVIRHMLEKENMMPMGGQGDKGRLIFVKIHPKAKTKPQYHKVYNDVIRALRVRKKKGKFTDKDALTRFNNDMKLAKKLWGISPNQFKQMVASNVLYDLSLNGFKYTPANLKELMQGSFIDSAIAFNKRNQIWMTNGYGASKEFIKSLKDDNGNPLVPDLSPRDNFKYVLIDDPTTPLRLKNKSLLALSTELPEHVDGAILVRSDVIKALNLDAGAPESGQNKSFIVDNTPQYKGGRQVITQLPSGGVRYGKTPLVEKNMGALLGKYMMHNVGNEYTLKDGTKFNPTNEMKKEGIHFMIMTSAAKQTGLRKVGNYDVNKKGELQLRNTEKYELNPESIKYSTSVINDSHMTQSQIWVKQLFTNLHQFGHKKIDKAIIKDIAREVIDKNFDGEPKINSELEKYKITKDDKRIDFLLDNLERIGTRELIEALKTPGLERFSERALQKMLRIVETDIDAQFREGEITAEERAESLNILSESISPIDRLLKNVALVGEEALDAGVSGYSGYMHKYIRDYKAAVLHNYFVKSVTRPVMDNSAVARIRPYDKWMQREFPELNKNDNIFYLDNAYKNTKIRLADETVTLNQLWKLRNDPKYKVWADKVFNALVLRVPMDSISGAHNLQFKGFTGRDGHGVMMHSRTMRAIGGADLDGDEAFIYFGGRLEDGTGYGMKKSWMDAIHLQRGEFYNKSKTNVTDNKTGKIPTGPFKGMTYRDILTTGEQGENALKEKKSLYYSPISRVIASEGAIQGRGMLGVAVSQGQVMKSAYNALMEAPNQTDQFKFTIRGKNGGTYRATVQPKTTAKDKQYQRELTRAQIAFASDPLDEAGLKPSSFFFESLHNAYFKTAFEKWNPKAKKYEKISDAPKGFKHYHLKGGLIGALQNMNRAYFSRNYDENRRFTMDEVNHLASEIRFLNEAQKNTLLPKMVERLEGLDWSDNLFNRINRNRIEETYQEIENMVKDKDGKFGKWLKDAMGRSSFRVPYNEHIDAVITNELYDKTIRHNIANDATIEGLRRFKSIAQKSMFGKEFNTKAGRLAKLYNYNERIKILEQMTRQAEDFLSNDLADMATLINIKRILESNRINPTRIRNIHSKVEKFKMQSYLNRRERKEIDYGAYEESAQQREANRHIEEFDAIMDAAEGRKTKKKDLAGDVRSATYDQMELDIAIRDYKKGLNKAEKELFDHLFIGTLNRGEINRIKKYMDMMPTKKNSPILRDLVSKLVKEASKTRQTRLAFNSEAISDIAIQNHFKAMNNLHSRMWAPMSKAEADAIAKETGRIVGEVKPEERVIIDELVQGAHKGQGYAGIKAGELTNYDKKLITDIATIIKKYNAKLGNNIPDLNEQIRGITARMDPDMRGKDLNALHRQDFENIRRYLQDVESGTMFQALWGKGVKPEIQKRYWSLFPETVNRELMAHDIKWLKQKGWFITRFGDIKEGDIRKPTFFLNMLQNVITRNNSMATSKAEGLAKEIEADFNHIQELKEGNALFKIAVAQRELGVKEDIDKLEEPASLKKHWKLIYDKQRNDIEKEFNWPKIKDKVFTILNDKGERVSVSGYEIVNGSINANLTGLKQRMNKKFEEMHKLIVGDKAAFDKYKTGKYFDPETRLQPKMNWRKFTKDVQNALEKGDVIPMELGVDGMRHIMRSMMYDLGSPKQQKTYGSWIIKNTGKVPFERYWPHMFYDRISSEKSIKKALDFIRKDMSLNEKQRAKAIEKLVIRQKTLTGEWEVQDTQDWDKVDVLEFTKGRERVADKKKISEDQVKWTDMNPSFHSMFSRKGHIEGWSTDINVMNAYAKNLANTYYRQVSHLMSRQILDEAYKRIARKTGDKNLAERWDRFFKLYVQGAMGQPDVIPERWYEDPKMKLKGTPYAWWADSNVLKRVNEIREKLGIRESDLPKQLKDFDYNDIRHWSNMEAKFELASLLAHPKTAITNIFGGSLHTIQSAGPGALRKARDIKWLKRINPKWNSLQDVEDFVVRKGVLPEFMIHELGLGKEVKGDIRGFVGELSSKINSIEKVKPSEIRTLGKKYGLTDAVMSKASKFMSVPERMLRRDAFMAHYVRAWERFGGAIKDPEHPFLIEIAKKGVKATQFLYEAPQRPLFARTALGKIMSRFQLYAWNSVRFRNDVIRNAKHYGFRPGTEAFNKFVRTAQIDLFVLALGNMFAYSLFDNALPQPWSWFQDTAEWLFGEDKEREKAFFGAYPTAIAPLQIVTPPLARFPVSALMQWARDDYTKFTDYQMYTALPFGRIVRDVFQPEKGLIDNPSRLLEKVSGMPLRDVQRFTTERKEKIESGERYKQPKVGY